MLTAKLQGDSGPSPAKADATGAFSIALTGKAKANNLVEVSGVASDGTPIYGKFEVLPASTTASEAPVTNPAKTATQSAAAALGAPAVIAAEGTSIAYLTPDKADFGKKNLRIFANVVDSNLKPVNDTSNPPQPMTGSCAPDTAGDKCPINFTRNLDGSWKLQAHEEALGSDGSSKLTGALIAADVTPIAPLGKPTISTPHQGDTTLTATLSSTDVTNVKPPVQLQINFEGLGSCTPNDATNQCSVTVDSFLTEGMKITAQETVGGVSRNVDAIATATVVDDSLGVPSISTVQENDKTAYLKLNPEDALKWAGKLSMLAEVYNGDTPVPGQSANCPTGANDYCTVTLTSALSAGQTIHVREIPAAGVTGGPSKPGPEAVTEVQELGFNWGRVRAYFSAGAVLSRSTITSGSSSQTNFSSPDAFAALDMDFNLLTKQGCLTSAYLVDTITLATLAEALAQCDYSRVRRMPAGLSDKLDNASAASLPNPTVKANLQKLLTQTTSVDDTSLIELLEKSLPYNNLAQKLPRLNSILAGLPASVTADMQKQILAKLKTLQLTPNEARKILEQTKSFERKEGNGLLLNTYFQSKLTQTASSNGASLASSPNSVHLETGIYLPVYSSWFRWRFAHQSYAIFAAPIAKIGFDSLRGSATDQLTQAAASASGTPTAGQLNYQNAVNALSKDIYRMMSVGVRLGFMRFAPTPNRAPETISYVDFSYGRFDNFFVQKYQDPNEGIRYPWRFDLVGAFKIPLMPLYIGSEINKGVGPDSMSIFVGLRTDLSSVLSKLVPTFK